MKWYIWVAIAVVAIIIIAVIINTNKQKNATLAQIAANTTPKGNFNPFDLTTVSA